MGQYYLYFLVCAFTMKNVFRDRLVDPPQVLREVFVAFSWVHSDVPIFSTTFPMYYARCVFKTKLHNDHLI